MTYQNDGKTDPHCLIKWKPDGTGGDFASQDTPQLCSGVPHGLKVTTEGGTQYLYGVHSGFLLISVHRYHANNQQKLAKTTLDGKIVWIKDGPFGQNMTCTNKTCPDNSCR